jgi:hypothetical protein
MERTLQQLVDAGGPDDSDLDPLERWWRDRQKWLEDHGYMLRPRYRPGWTPSWLGIAQDSFLSEDAPSMMVRTVLPSSNSSGRSYS